MFTNLCCRLLDCRELKPERLTRVPEFPGDEQLSAEERIVVEVGGGGGDDDNNNDNGTEVGKDEEKLGKNH